MALDFMNSLASMPQIDPAQLQIPQGQGPVGAVQPSMQQPGILQQVLHKLQDPNVRQAIAATGINLLRSPAYGQSGWDVGANALGAGLDTLQQLREKDRQQALQTQAHTEKVQQQAVDNTRADRQVATSEQNAATNTRATDSNIEQNKSASMRADKNLDEAIRHNKSEEEIARLRAEADRIKANAYSNGRAGKTSAEIEKINRLKAYYIQQNPGMDDSEADKMAIDYVTNSKGKPPRQLVVEAYQAKVKQWFDQQYDPNAKPTPEMQQQWQQEAANEIRTLDEAGKEMTDTRGNIKRPPAATVAPPISSATPPAVTPPGAPPAAPAAKNDLTLRNVEKWKLAGATPEQIKVLLATGGENPQTYGY